MKTSSLFVFPKTFYVFLRLLQRDLILFKRQYVDFTINAIVWPVQASIIFGYIFPLMGMNKGYGAFVIIANVVFKCLYEAYLQASMAVADLNSYRSIEFEYTLPLPAWAILAKYLSYFTIRCFALSIPSIAISKLILYDRFSLEQWNPFHTFISFFATCMFFGFFSIWLAGKIKNQMEFENVWVRCFDPMVNLGCYFFTWYTMHQFLPLLAYICLLNPVALASEALRSSFLGGVDVLPFWPCMAGLALQSILMGIVAYKAIKKRLDFVV